MNEARGAMIGFVGLGAMGLPMAEAILEAGWPMVAYDPNPRALDAIVSRGAQAARGPAEVARGAAVVISMVGTTEQAHDVIARPGGFIDAVQPGDLVISMSTIQPAAYAVMQEKLAAKGASLIDAPVTGMPTGARERTLKAFVGGANSDVQRATPLLKSMCAEVHPMGALGQGTAMKLVNSMLFQVTRLVVTEGLVLGVKAGLDLRRMTEVLGRTTANSGALQSIAPRLLARNFEGAVRMEITCKDVELESAFAKSVHSPAFMVTLAQQIYEMARGMGLGEQDPSSVVKVYEHFTGIVVGGLAADAVVAI